ncbi:MAG: PadR family transcriptional regulator [Christensenellaceae bacterium]|jgi:DNA-binding PadR family transcriptional regulator|nr:PadR family transcriptional regulator [Christensenellaceae bacterium]
MDLDHAALTEGVYYILLSLYQPRHGYAIMQNISALSGSRVNLGPGTLYGALNTLLEKRWIESLPGQSAGRKKEYRITAQGKAAVEAELVRLRELIKNGQHITEAESI